MFVIKRRSIIIISVLLVSVLTALFCLSALSENGVGNADSTGITIVLDAGHGGVDGGVIGVKTGVKESDLNLTIVKKLRRLLEDAGMTVILTRSSEAGLYGVATENLKRKDMEKRRDIINSSDPELVISVHMNKYTLHSRRGAQVFFKKTDESAKLLADSIQSELNGMKEASRTCSTLSGDYYILNCSKIPSVIVECGFLSNAEDEALLINGEYQDSLCYTLFRGVVKYLSEASISYYP